MRDIVGLDISNLATRACWLIGPWKKTLSRTENSRSERIGAQLAEICSHKISGFLASNELYEDKEIDESEAEKLSFQMIILSRKSLRKESKKIAHKNDFILKIQFK